MSEEGLHLVIPGPLDQRTGGYLYDARMAVGLRTLGWTVRVHSLDGAFPEADAVATLSLARALASVPTGDRVLIDGLAMGALPGPVRASAARLRVLGLVHHPLAEETGLEDEARVRLAALEREALAACVGVIVTSAFTASRLEAYDVPASRVRTVLPGTDAAEPAIGPATGKPPVLLCVGTVTPRKGHDVLVRALERVRGERWTCLCAGGLDRAPAFAKAVRDQVERAGLGDRVTFLGERGPDELAELYHGASIFVLPSHYEGYGMALAEALARALPVVTTTGGAIPFTVPADVGLLVPPGDHVALGDALASLLSGPGAETRRSDLTRAAFRHARTQPSWDQAVRAFAGAVLELAPRG